MSHFKAKMHEILLLRRLSVRLSVHPTSVRLLDGFDIKTNPTSIPPTSDVILPVNYENYASVCSHVECCAEMCTVFSMVKMLNCL